MSFDSHPNLVGGTVSAAPVPAASGTELTVSADFLARLAASGKSAPFNCTVYPVGEVPTRDNAEIVRVLSLAGAVATIERAQETTSARAVQAGDEIAVTATAKSFIDIEAALDGYGYVAPPAANNSTGTKGQWSYDSGYYYRCVAANTWVQIPAVTTFP